MTDTSDARQPAAVARATLVGGTAVLMWATLAPLTILAGTVPPFLLVALTFGLGALVGIGWQIARGEDPRRHLRQSPRAWAIGVGGLFGYHFVYFLSLRLAPAVEVSLINYLWPLLIVLFSALLPGERLRSWHVAGALAGLAGTVLLVTRGGAVAVSAANVPGYLLALAAAVLWAAYSVLRRRFGDAPTEAVAGFCLATSVLAGLCHLLLETTAWPADATTWAAVVALGLGPVGGAFYVWDQGVRKGDIRALGALSYATPLLSTVLLIGLGFAPGHWTVWRACALIAGGSILASRDLLRRR
ncbi:MAG: DMT family transporter [Rhodospirillales bacterium]